MKSQRHGPFELFKDHPWMMSVLSNLSYYHISNHGKDEPISSFVLVIEA
jgi:hypothetical protein